MKTILIGEMFGQIAQQVGGKYCLKVCRNGQILILGKLQPISGKKY